MTLLTTSNAKIAKSNKSPEFLTAILHLAPAKLSGKNVCPYASAGCAAACLNTAGRGAMNNVQEARIRKTQAFYSNRQAFLEELAHEIDKLRTKAHKQNKKLAIRLNGTSDIRWENVRFGDYPSIMDAFPDVQFYDYTKFPYASRVEIPANYHLTYSRSEVTPNASVLENLENGRNVAVVFDELPETYLGYPVIDGDANDMRFLDLEGVVVGLTAKGKGKTDTSGFVVQIAG